MKGLIFCEFLDMVEHTYSEEMLEELFESVSLASEGAYTTVGTYDYREMIALVDALAARTQQPAATLLRQFGHHLASAFSTKFSHFFGNAPSLFEFLKSIEHHIHVEVRKLYPDAELPAFDYRQESLSELRMFYRSARPMAMLALGLIEGCASYYGETISVQMQSLPDDEQGRTEFVINRMTKHI